jgi:hypothetical protein
MFSFITFALQSTAPAGNQLDTGELPLFTDCGQAAVDCKLNFTKIYFP